MARPAAFVGRDNELSQLLKVLSGESRLVLVAGDAGVGKTRFVTEGMTRATATGMVMMRGECLPLASTLPLLPVASALGELARLEDGRLLAGALQDAPPFAGEEIGRLLPHLNPGGESGPDERDRGWRRERLFSAIEEVLEAVACRSAVGLVVEDLHWADHATLDCLTFLARPGRRSAVTVVVTCRSDEAPVAAHVGDWLTDVRGAAGVEEIRLGPLSRADVAGLVAALAEGPVPQPVVDELYARAEGNPFFTEQLVSAAPAGPRGDPLMLPAGLPARLAELLVARAARCAGNGQTVLAGLAVAGRPLAEDLLSAVTGLDAEAVRTGLRELAAARLLAEDTADGGHRPRHALLAEAVAGGLLPGERTGLHERTARALAAGGDESLAAEVAGHWQAAGDPAEELPARAAAGGAAEQVFGYAEAAAHWRRAIELSRALPAVADVAGLDLPRLYVRAMDALTLCGNNLDASELAEEAYRWFAAHPDPATAAVACHRAATYRADLAAGLPLIEEALRLFERAPPSGDHAEAWFDYASIFLLYVEGRQQASIPALNRALEIAETSGATALIPRILAAIAYDAFVHGRIDRGFAILQRGWALVSPSEDGTALLSVAINESNALLRLAQFGRAADVARRSINAARQAGLEAWEGTGVLAYNAAEALLALGRTTEAATLIDPQTSGAPDRDHWLVHMIRAEIDVLRGDADAAARRQQLVYSFPTAVGRVDFSYEAAPRTVEAELWAGDPGAAIRETRRALALFTVPDLTFLCGRLLTAGMRACADLAAQALARRDEPAGVAAVAAGDDLVSWVEQMAAGPFIDHPFMATIPAERAVWNAERTRLAGSSDPRAWSSAAKAWQDLGCPHRAGYAWWRQAEAQLDAARQTGAAAGPLRAAAAAAGGHAPLLAQIRALAERARITLQAQEAARDSPSPAAIPGPYGLTSRELAVLRLVAAGRTNAQIGADLYISPKTAGVHVGSILRKLGVSGRVQAAALAERAGMLGSRQS
jgi:DNA-binding CsgD family transcriptional regulator/tetratricopeptide (TPR) repeat protein